MTNRRLSQCLMCALCLVAGCVNPTRTRLPSLGYGDPRAERQSYNIHDPLPERDIGPMVERPREFARERTEPRRTIERRANISGFGATDPTAYGGGRARVSQTVTP